MSVEALCPPLASSLGIVWDYSIVETLSGIWLDANKFEEQCCMRTRLTS